MVSSILKQHQVTQELKIWIQMNEFLVFSGMSADWNFRHGVLLEDCSMQQDRQPQMPEGRWLQCSSLEWIDLQMRQNGGMIGLQSSWPEYSASIGKKEPIHGCNDAQECTTWNKPAPRCPASGAGDGWRQTRDFFVNSFCTLEPFKYCHQTFGWSVGQYAVQDCLIPK